MNYRIPWLNTDIYGNDTVNVAIECLHGCMDTPFEAALSGTNANGTVGVLSRSDRIVYEPYGEYISIR